MTNKQKEWIAFAILGVVLLAAIFAKPDVCRADYAKYGLVMETCHEGVIRQTASLGVREARRGGHGFIDFVPFAHYTTGDSDEVHTTSRIPPPKSLALSLVDDNGKSRPIAPVEGWHGDEGTQYGKLDLPVDLPDGDYKLHADYETTIGKGAIDVPLALYTPARVHVISDRPLYEPGNTLKFRATVLRARDLAPLDGRPGRWIVKDPDGTVLLEEKAPATDWGVVAGSFPIDKGAPTGRWTIAWESGGATDEIGVDVKPFTLPRFRVEAAADKPFYTSNDTPSVKGAVLYSSGAPVANAQIEIAWTFSGEWPPPTEWTEKLLPKHATTAANGRFELALPKIPADLVGRVTMAAHLSAIDPAGDRVESTAAVLLAKDGIQVSSVTELANGIVQGFNNRMYLRVSTPDGRTVAGSKLSVKRAWDPTDKGETTTTDEDGVASLQIDPGAPVSIVIPALPYRPSKPQPLVSRGEPQEMIGGEGASLADQVEMDRWLASLAPCAKHFDGEGNVKVGLRVDRGGGITQAIGTSGALGRCTASVVRGKRLPAGNERMYAITFQYTDPPLPSVTASVEATLDNVPEGLQERIDELARTGRDCLPNDEALDGELPLALVWRGTENSKFVELAGWIGTIPDQALGRAMSCVQNHVNGRIELANPLDSDALGLVRFSMSSPTIAGDERPQATTKVGYELLVTADTPGNPSTKFFVNPGTVPPLRLRVSPILAKVGDEITAELIRGPEFSGVLPKEMTLEHLGKPDPTKAPVDDEHKSKFKIEPGTEGWVEIKGGGQRALVYVKPLAELSVAMKARSPVYKPGDKAELEITTLVGGKGGKAAVGLIGVDESLGQLVSLPGPDDMGRVRPQVETSEPAFDTLDGQALVLGRIRGANAAAATVLRVTTIPPPPELDAVITARATSQFDENEELTDRFFTVLAELHVQARAWEAQAPAGQKMHPADMAKLWTQAVDAVIARKERADDAYGRRLLLRRLPQDLLALTDPRNVIVVGTRLPEDVENWAQWVRKEQP